MTEKVSLKLRAGIWMSVAAVLGVFAALLVIEAVVFAIASFGIAFHWACLLVAAGLAVIGAAAFAKGRADASEELTPTHTIRQVKQDIATTKEQLA
jgi:hypothetical protein